MSQEEDRKIQIEQLRQKMYHAYQTSESYETILKISTELDQLLNAHIDSKIDKSYE